MERISTQRQKACASPSPVPSARCSWFRRRGWFWFCKSVSAVSPGRMFQRSVQPLPSPHSRRPEMASRRPSGRNRSAPQPPRQLHGGAVPNPGSPVPLPSTVSPWLARSNPPSPNARFHPTTRSSGSRAWRGGRGIKGGIEDTTRSSRLGPQLIGSGVREPDVNPAACRCCSGLRSMVPRTSPQGCGLRAEDDQPGCADQSHAGGAVIGGIWRSPLLATLLSKRKRKSQWR